MNKKLILVLFAGFLFGGVLAGGILWISMRKKAPAALPAEVQTAKHTKKANHSQKQSAKKQTVKMPTKRPRPKLQFTNSVPEIYKQDIVNLRNALDQDDHKNIVDAAKHLLASDQKDLRVEAADALNYSGWEGLSLLTSLLIDEDPDVAESARSAFDFTLFEMENQKTKQKLLSVAAELVAPVDPDYFTELLSGYSMEVSDNEIITFAYGLYNENLPDESKQAIFQAIQDVTFSDPITNIEDGRKEIEKWRKENSEWIKMQDSLDINADF